MPTRPTKITDSRAKTFVGESVEVDAIPSRLMRRIVENAIDAWIEDDALAATRTVEAQELEGLRAMAAGWKS